MNVGETLAPRAFLSYKQALAWLYGLQRFGIKLGLENIRRLLDELSRSGGFQAADQTDGRSEDGRCLTLSIPRLKRIPDQS